VVNFVILVMVGGGLGAMLREFTMLMMPNPAEGFPLNILVSHPQLRWLPDSLKRLAKDSCAPSLETRVSSNVLQVHISADRIVVYPVRAQVAE
jgi:hypothetical protein